MVNKKEYLKEMGIEIWLDKTSQKVNEVAQPSCKTVTATLAKSDSLMGDDLSDVKRQVSICTLCDLHKTRTNTVFGVGNENADAMFIGEAPGANEDLKGEPFVGRAGMLLNSMLQAIGLKRDDIYIANILKCRPPGNRDPMAEEVILCTPYLQRQIALIQPKILIAVGRIAAQFLLNTEEPMSRLRGQMYQYGAKSIPLLVTYHPAYLLRSPSEKRKAYLDFRKIKEALIQNV